LFSDGICENVLRAYWYIPCGREQELKPLTEWDVCGFITGTFAPKTKERGREG